MIRPIGVGASSSMAVVKAANPSWQPEIYEAWSDWLEGDAIQCSFRLVVVAPATATSDSKVTPEYNKVVINWKQPNNMMDN